MDARVDSRALREQLRLLGAVVEDDVVEEFVRGLRSGDNVDLGDLGLDDDDVGLDQRRVAALHPPPSRKLQQSSQSQQPPPPQQQQWPEGEPTVPISGRRAAAGLAREALRDAPVAGPVGSVYSQQDQGLQQAAGGVQPAAWPTAAALAESYESGAQSGDDASSTGSSPLRRAELDARCRTFLAKLTLGGRRGGAGTGSRAGADDVYSNGAWAAEQRVRGDGTTEWATARAESGRMFDSEATARTAGLPLAQGAVAPPLSRTASHTAAGGGAYERAAAAYQRLGSEDYGEESDDDSVVIREQRPHSSDAAACRDRGGSLPGAVPSRAQLPGSRQSGMLSDLWGQLGEGADSSDEESWAEVTRAADLWRQQQEQVRQQLAQPPPAAQGPAAVARPPPLAVQSPRGGQSSALWGCSPSSRALQSRHAEEASIIGAASGTAPSHAHHSRGEDPMFRAPSASPTASSAGAHAPTPARVVPSPVSPVPPMRRPALQPSQRGGASSGPARRMGGRAVGHSAAHGMAVPRRTVPRQQQQQQQPQQEPADKYKRLALIDAGWSPAEAAAVCAVRASRTSSVSSGSVATAATRRTGGARLGARAPPAPTVRKTDRVNRWRELADGWSRDRFLQSGAGGANKEAHRPTENFAALFAAAHADAEAERRAAVLSGRTRGL